MTLTASAPVIEVVDTLNHVADQLAPINRENAFRLRSLADTVNDDTQVKHIANLDLGHVLDLNLVEEQASHYFQSRPISPFLVSVLEFARNVLVLLPIGYTWLELSSAANRYRIALQADPSLERLPFLLLWEQGFNNVSGTTGSTFSQAAFWVVVLIGIIVVLTVMVHGVQNVQAEWAGAKARALRQHVEEAIWKLNQLLARERGTQDLSMAGVNVRDAVVDFNRNTGAVLRQLAAEQARLESTVGERVTELERIQTFSDAMNQNVLNLITHADDVRGTYEQTRATLSDLSAHLENIASQQSSILTAFGEVVGSADLYHDSVRIMNQSIQSATDRLNAVSDQNQAQSQQITDAVAGINGLIATLTDGDVALRDALVRVAGDMRAISQLIETQNQEMATFLRENRDASGTLALGVSELSAVTERVSLALAQMGEYQQHSLQRFDSATATLDNAANAVQTQVGQLNATVQSLGAGLSSLENSIVQWGRVRGGMVGSTSSPARGLGYWVPMGITIGLALVSLQAGGWLIGVLGGLLRDLLG